MGRNGRAAHPIHHRRLQRRNLPSAYGAGEVEGRSAARPCKGEDEEPEEGEGAAGASASVRLPVKPGLERWG